MNRKQFIAYSAAIGSGLLFDSNRILADTLSGLSNKSKRKLVLFSLAGGIRFQDLWLMKDLLTMTWAWQKDLLLDLKKASSYQIFF